MSRNDSSASCSRVYKNMNAAGICELVNQTHYSIKLPACQRNIVRLGKQTANCCSTRGTADEISSHWFFYPWQWLRGDSCPGVIILNSRYAAVEYNMRQQMGVNNEWLIWLTLCRMHWPCKLTSRLLPALKGKLIFKLRKRFTERWVSVCSVHRGMNCDSGAAVHSH